MFVSTFVKKGVAVSMKSSPSQAATLLRPFSSVFQSIDSVQNASKVRSSKEGRMYHAFEMKRDGKGSTIHPYEYAENEELSFSTHTPPLLAELYASMNVKARRSSSTKTTIGDYNGAAKQSHL